MAQPVDDIFSPGNPEDLFEIYQILNEGEFGSTYKAILKATKQHCALKRIEFKQIDDCNKFTREIATWKLPTHQVFTTLIGIWQQTPTNYWIAVDLCEFESLLGAIILTKHGLQEAQLSFVLRQVLEGLIELHSNNKVHRRIQGSNILLT
ncbi:MAG: hypothetical protein EZS28_021179, partial [Streblomastix strix]